MNFAKQLVNQLDNAKQRGETHIVVNGVRHSVKVLENIGSALTTEQRIGRNDRISEHLKSTDWKSEYELAVQRNLASGLKGRDAVRAVDPVLRDRYIRQANQQEQQRQALDMQRAAAGRKQRTR